MTERDLPHDTEPLTPFEYWRETMAVWTDFSRQTTKIVAGQVTALAPSQVDPNPAEAETLASELLRTMSDMNLRHWQNTARLLDGFPAWMRLPHNMAGSALVDWFDQMKRKKQPISLSSVAGHPEAGGSEEIRKPLSLAVPSGEADDLTKIKGIGPKLSALLNQLGIFHFKQIANWTDAEARWVDDYLAFKGRVEREDWIPQAKALSANGSALVH